MNASITYESSDSRQASLVINAPHTDQRAPSHFIVLLDTSDSMNEDNKLEHVKLCTSLLLKLLTPADKISLITFGDTSQIFLFCVPTTGANIKATEEAIDSLVTDGCTNLSAGIASVAELLAMTSEEAKPTLLLLTDGHANRGVSATERLHEMMDGMLNQFPTLSLSVVAYGTNHNAELLNGFAVKAHGSYSIVESLEDAAVALGNALGGALSCVAQNVEILCPPETTVSGPYTCKNGRIRVGDLYSGASSMFLMTLPEGPVTIRGMLVPSMEPFTMEAKASVSTGRNAEVELTRLRYQCSALFRRMRLGQDAALTQDIRDFRTALSDPFLAGHPITTMLANEATSLEEAAALVRLSVPVPELATRLLQHEAFTSLGSGTTRPIRQESAFPADPTSLSLEDPVAQLSPMSSRAQRRMASLMRTMSLGTN